MAPEPTADTIAASIIVCTRDRRAALADCLAAIPWEHLPGLGAEVIVVDDGTRDGSGDWVRAAHPGARLIANAAPMGPSHGRNRAAAIARGRLLVFLDDDAVPQPGWLEAILARDDGTRILGGRILDMDSDREQGGPARHTFLGKRLPCAPGRANAGTSANLAVPAEAFRALGGFDEDLPYYFEDSDLCIRATRAGFGFAYLPEAVVRHRGSERKTGRAIHLQERHSTYAMLKAYRGDWPRLAAFTAANAVWMIARAIAWTAAGRPGDAARLWRGWREAHARFARGGPWPET